ncbi:MFS transporter [Streptomyces sp. NPDC052052]|uniref:MFS transporter n=1 Tax=Streptomyces sp. NPDC052052 TaxID=3154756 RepID=UPI003437363A
MTEQIQVPEPGATPALSPDPAEDAGRLDHASTGRLVTVLLALVVLSEILPLQQSMVSVILPKMAADFPAAGSGVTWSMTILGVVGGATMALVGKLGDVWGKKRVLFLCSALFLISTVVCALTTDWSVFLVARGLGAVSWGMSAVEYGIVRDLMPRRWIPISVGVLGTGFGLSSVIGPLAVGALEDHFGWRSIFWFLAGYTLVALPFTALAVPESTIRVRQRFDLLGALLFGAGVGLVLIYISQGSTWGWSEPTCLAYLIGGLVGLVAFVAWEARTKDPIMELSLLRKPSVATLMTIALLGTAVLSATSIAVIYMFETPPAAELKAQILQGIASSQNIPVEQLSQLVTFQGDVGYGAGFSVLQLAVHITMWTAVFGMVFGPLGGYVAKKKGARLTMIISAVGFLAACLLWVPWHSTWQQQLTIGVLFGLGFGFFYAAGPNLLMDAVPAQRQGVSAGMYAVFGGIGTSVATAVFTAIVSAHPLTFTMTGRDGAPVVTEVPQVYADSGFRSVYLLVGVVPAAVMLLLALALRIGRTPARGGEAPAA